MGEEVTYASLNGSSSESGLFATIKRMFNAI